MKGSKWLISFVCALSIVLLVGTGVVSADAPNGSGAIDSTAEFVSDEILVKFTPGTSAADIAKFNRSHGTTVKRELHQIGVKVLRVPSGRVLEKVAAYEKNPNVVYAEPNYIRQLEEGLSVPGDPGFTYQWALDNFGQFGGKPDADIDWLEAYDALSEVTLDSVIVAVNDSGIDPLHPDLYQKLLILPGSDIIGSDSDPTDGQAPSSPTYGHGTHVAGIAGADTDNGDGVAGVAFDVSTQIMPVRIFGDDGATTIDAICDGLAFAVDNGARVINMSYGGLFPSNAEADAVTYAWNNGAVLVAAAGNWGEYGTLATWENYPAAYPEVIAVSATNDQDLLTYYSSYGSWLSVAAPGGDTSMTAYGGIVSTYPGATYRWWSGTSMAAPHVSGLAALLFAQNPARTNQEVRSIIETTADDLGAPNFDIAYGHGRINVCSAVQYGATDEYTLTVSLDGSGSVTKNPDQATYLSGTVVGLTATPDAGWSFSHWSGDLTGSTNPDSITMDGDKTVTAHFTQDQYTLTVSVDGSGSVTKNPDQATYLSGTVVELTATPDAGWSFSHWSGDLTGSANPDSIAMDGDKTVTAHFTSGVSLWSSGDLETGTWSASGNPRGRDASKDYSCLPPSSITNMQAMWVSIGVANYIDSGSEAAGDASPYIEVYIKEKGKQLTQINVEWTPTGNDTCDFQLAPSLFGKIVPGKTNNIRVVIGSLNKDRSTGNNDLVEVDYVEVKIEYQP